MLGGGGGNHCSLSVFGETDRFSKKSCRMHNAFTLSSLIEAENDESVF